MNRRSFLKLTATTPLIGLISKDKPKYTVLLGQAEPQKRVKWSSDTETWGSGDYQYLWCKYLGGGQWQVIGKA